MGAVVDLGGFALILILNSAVSVKILDVEEHFETECYGTSVGFGYSGSEDFHYESLRRRYSGCSYVQGNLEITNLGYSENSTFTYDLKFLSTIRVVTGYVLLGLLEVDTVPLTNLRLIRADNTYSLMGEEYGLVVALTYGKGVDGESVGLRELQLPALREISRGKVLFSQNPMLCHVNTIAWDSIVPGKRERGPVTFIENGFSKNCTECNPACEPKGKGRCWGSGKKMCQRNHDSKCHPSCPGRCYDSYILGCCHPECAIGCWGPLEHDCEMCKYFKHGNRCISTCPPETYPMGQECIKY